MVGGGLRGPGPRPDRFGCHLFCPGLGEPGWRWGGFVFAWPGFPEPDLAEPKVSLKTYSVSIYFSWAWPWVCQVKFMTVPLVCLIKRLMCICTCEVDVVWQRVTKGFTNRWS